MGSHLIDQLERRTLLSAALDDTGVLRIIGTDAVDNVSVWVQSKTQLGVSQNGANQYFSRSAVRKIYFDGRGGNDNFTMSRDMTKPLEAFGGMGGDRITAGAGNDTINGSRGHDLVNAGGGNDSVRGGLGNDSLMGEAGNDYIDGGEANDVIADRLGTNTLIGGTGINQINTGAASQHQPYYTASYQPYAFLSSVVGYDPVQIRKAYGLGSLSDSSYMNRGQGETIYIPIAFSGRNTFGDLCTFSEQFSLPKPDLQIVNATGRLPAEDAGWAMEANLDLQWAHAIAPAAKLVLVQADSNMDVDIIKAVRKAASMANGVGGVVSLSFGRDTVLSNQAEWDTLFQSFSKVTFVVAAGEDFTGTGIPTQNVLASSGFVTSVGGTTLRLDSEGNRVNEEIAWAFGGGGASLLYPKPSFQTGIILEQIPGIPLANQDARGLPDVAYNADFNTPYAIFASTPLDGNRGWFAVGGTSAGAPQWAGIVTLANQKRREVGKAAIGGTLNGVLYDLYNEGELHQSMDGENAMLDIIAGNALGNQAFPRYDMATGLGVPNGNELIKDLTNFQPFYMQNDFTFNATLLLPPNTPIADPDIPLVNSILIGRPRAGTGSISGGDTVDLTFDTNRPNAFYDPAGLSTGDTYFDVDEGETSSVHVRLHRSGRGQSSGAIYGRGSATVAITDPALFDTFETNPTFLLDFSGSWWTGSDGEVHFSIEFKASDRPTSVFQLTFDDTRADFGASFSGKISG